MAYFPDPIHPCIFCNGCLQKISSDIFNYFNLSVNLRYYSKCWQLFDLVRENCRNDSQQGGTSPYFLKLFPVHMEILLSEELQNNVYKKSLIKDKCYTLVEKVNKRYIIHTTCQSWSYVQTHESSKSHT